MIDNKIIKNQDKELKLASKIREREYRKRLGLHLLLRLWLHLHENEKPSEITEPTKCMEIIFYFIRDATGQVGPFPPLPIQTRYSFGLL